jgi:hypothetical protein
MTSQEFQALQDAARGLILFHSGLWGAPMCYMWAGSDGREAGRVPSWESEALDRLLARRLTTVKPATGAKDGQVMATDAGSDLLSSLGYSTTAA